MAVVIGENLNRKAIKLSVGSGAGEWAQIAFKIPRPDWKTFHFSLIGAQEEYQGPPPGEPLYFYGYVGLASGPNVWLNNNNTNLFVGIRRRFRYYHSWRYTFASSSACWHSKKVGPSWTELDTDSWSAFYYAPGHASGYLPIFRVHFMYRRHLPGRALMWGYWRHWIPADGEVGYEPTVTERMLEAAMPDFFFVPDDVGEYYYAMDCPEQEHEQNLEWCYFGLNLDNFPLSLHIFNAGCRVQYPEDYLPWEEVPWL